MNLLRGYGIIPKTFFTKYLRKFNIYIFYEPGKRIRNTDGEKLRNG